MVVRGRTRNAIGPQGRVGSTPTISALKKDCCSYSNPFLVIRARPCFHCEVFRVPKNGALKTNKPPAMQVSQHCFSLQQKNLQ